MTMSLWVTSMNWLPAPSFAYELGEVLAVRLVEGGIHLVQYVERRRLEELERENEHQGHECLLAPGERIQRMILVVPAELYEHAALERVGRVAQVQVPLADVYVCEEPGEVVAHGIERLEERLLLVLLYLVDHGHDGLALAVELLYLAPARPLSRPSSCRTSLWRSC